MEQHPSAPPIPPELYENLERQVWSSGQLLDILEEELATLTAMDIQTLIGLIRKKESQIKRLHLLDATFQEIAGAYLQAAGQPVRLAEVVARAPAEEAERLARYRTSLLTVRHRIHDRNLINHQLAQDILQYLNDAISLITPTAAGRPLYGKGGLARPSAKQPVLLSREI